MNLLRNVCRFAVFMVILAAGRLTAADLPEGKTTRIPVETIVDKIRGGLLGEILGNLNGIPHEMQYIDEPGNVKNYIPSLPNGAWTDDDTDFEWTYIIEMQRRRNVFLSSDEIASLWRERINRRIWCANRYARFLMDVDIKPPHTGSVVLNPWSDFNVSGQFLCETFALIAPAMPRTASRIGLNYTTVAIGGEPAQTTQLFTTMISAAFMESDMDKILDAGMAALDPASKIFRIVDDVRQWHNKNPADWRETRRLLRDKYQLDGGRMRDKNGCELNTGAIIAALLYGEGDFPETLKLAFNLGWDADCNAATVGTIIGVVYGYREMMNQGWQIVDRYRNTTRDNMPEDETITSFADRIIGLFEMVNEQNGGSKTIAGNVPVYEIPVEDPAPVINAESHSEQALRMRAELEQEITQNILSGGREEKARAAYMAVCLDMAADMKKRYPRQWKDACYNLSGYWKIMANIFQGDGENPFSNLAALEEKFKTAGFVSPVKKFSERELEGTAVWMNPAKLY